MGGSIQRSNLGVKGILRESSNMRSVLTKFGEITILAGHKVGRNYNISRA